LDKVLRDIINKHQLPVPQALAYRTAARRVLEVADDPDAVDLSNVDVEDLLRRFRIKNKTKLAEQSFAAYESRFRRGLTMYLRWLDNEPDWAGKSWRSRKPGIKTVSNGESGARTPPPTSTPPVPVSASVDEHGQNGGTFPEKPELFDYPVALVDSKVTAILRLPRTYTTGDAARMSALINALAVRPTLAPRRPPATSNSWIRLPWSPPSPTPDGATLSCF
jgi:hypothetical protein